MCNIIVRESYCVIVIVIEYLRCHVWYVGVGGIEVFQT